MLCNYKHCLDNREGICQIPDMTRQICQDNFLYPVRIREEFSWDGYEERRKMNL